MHMKPRRSCGKQATISIARAVLANNASFCLSVMRRNRRIDFCTQPAFGDNAFHYDFLVERGRLEPPMSRESFLREKGHE